MKGAFEFMKILCRLTIKDKDVRNAVLLSPIDLPLLSIRELANLFMETIKSDERITKALYKCAKEVQNEDLSEEDRNELHGLFEDFFKNMEQSKVSK